jgi:geranylgeranyl pyrophosphate synthase
VADLRAHDRRFAHMVQIGRLRGGSLNSGFVAARTAAPGLFLVGDAAGLVDPFTGEGIQWALESGALAAQLIGDKGSCGGPSTTHYPQLLEDRYRERFAFGRRFLKTKAFAWRLLEETFRFEEPLFKQFRRAMLDFGPQAFPRTQEASSLVPLNESVPATQAFFTAVGGHIDRLLARQFPLVARISRSWVANPDGLSRIITYWHAARWGDATAPTHVQGGACVELAHLGHLVLHDVHRSQPSDRASGQTEFGVKWANAFAVMTGDFFLAKAYTLAAQLGPSICRLLAQVSAGICAAEARVCDGSHEAMRYSANDYLVSLASRAPALHGFACNVACELAAVPPALTATLANFSTDLGIASHLAAEAREFASLEESACTIAITSRLSRGAWSFPLLLAADALDVGPSATRSASCAPPEIIHELVDIIRTGPIIQTTLDQARRFVCRAKAHVAALPPINLRGEMLRAADGLVPVVFASPPPSGSEFVTPFVGSTRLECVEADPEEAEALLSVHPQPRDQATDPRARAR